MQPPPPGAAASPDLDATVLAALDLRPAPVTVTGPADVLPSPFAVLPLALASLAAEVAAAVAAGLAHGPLRLDTRHVGASFTSERHVRLDGRSLGAPFDPLSRFHRTADGWVRLHGNYPHHRAALYRVLGPDPAAARRWVAVDLETAVVDAGGCAAAVRTGAQWAASAPGAAVAPLPVLSLHQVGDGPERALPATPRVLDLTRVIAGPVAGRSLAAYGADVLRVDDPDRPEILLQAVDTGPGKRSTLLDLRDRHALNALADLLAEADVLLHAYRPGVLDRFGLGADELAARYPHLVVVGISAWDTTGPWATRRGFDSLVQAAVGIADATRGDDGRPGVLPAQALDHGTGHLAAAAALAALARRRREGGTWHARLSLARTALALTDARAAGERSSDGAPDATTTPGTAGGPGAPLDPAPFLTALDSPMGRVTLVAPPGSPVWRHGPVPIGHDPASWAD